MRTLGRSLLCNARILTIAAVVTAALLIAGVPDASACTDRTRTPVLNAKSLVPLPVPMSPGHDRFDRNAEDDIVGLWFAVFKTPDGNIWNKGFQQYHADKTELSVDNAVPPSLGNICVGVWKMVGPRTYKLRHMTWNWNPDGTPAGTFLLITTVKLDAHGNVYLGTFESDSFDLAGHKIPALHAEGTLRGLRITVD